MTLATLLKKLIITGMFSLSVGCTSANHKCGEDRQHYYNHTNYENTHATCRSKYGELNKKPYRAITDPEESEKEISKCKENGFSCLVADLETKLGRIAQAIKGYERAEKYEESAKLKGKIGDTAGAKEDYLKAFKQYLEQKKCPTCALRTAELSKQTDLITTAKKELLTQAEQQKDYPYATDLSEQLNENERAVTNAEKAELHQRAAQIAEKSGLKEKAIQNYEILGYKEDAIRIAIQSGTQAAKKEDYESALKFYEYAARLGDAGSISDAARLAHKIKKYEKAIELHKRNGTYELVKDKILSDARKHINELIEQGELFEARDLAKLMGEKIAFEQFATNLKKIVDAETKQTNNPAQKNLQDYSKYLENFLTEKSQN